MIRHSKKAGRVENGDNGFVAGGRERDPDHNEE